MITMPKPIKFKSGFYTWKINWSNERVEEAFGKTCSVSKTITIYKQGNKQIERETLLHELLHVALEDKCEAVFNLDDKPENKEENLIRLLSPVLMNILENKELVRFLFKQ